MDSGNSGSLQSSSGAEEECDSRTAVDFTTTHHHPHPPLPAFNHHVFDQNQINNPLFFTASSSSSPQHQILNLDSVVWSKTLPSFSDHQFFNSSSQHHHSSHTVPFPPTPAISTTATAPITSTNPSPAPARNPKKRSRASRRAPTTVLTTDTNNFRAMVQEFTGIPAPPFTSPSPAFPRLTTGFDLFGRPPSVRSNANNFDNLPQLPPYLLRPFSHKLQSSPPSSSSISSLLDSGINNSNNTMQNTILLPSNSLNQTASFLHPKTTQNVHSSNAFGLVGQSQIHGLQASLLDTATAPAQATMRNDNRVATGNWDGGGVNYTNGKESDHHVSSGMKGDQGFIEPWICSSD